MIELTETDSTGIQKAFDEVGIGTKENEIQFVSGDYEINKPLKINSGTTLLGEDGVVFKLMDKASLSVFSGDPEKKIVPIIGQKEKTIKDVIIKYIEFDGNKDNQTAIHGKNYHNFVYLTKAENIDISNNYIHDLQGDGIRIRDGNKLNFYENRIYYPGHDGIHTRNCDNVTAVYNDIKLRIDSGIRVINTNNVIISDNYITGYVQEGAQEWSRGGSGIQIDRFENVTCDNINVFNNYVEGSYGAGIWASSFGTSSKDLNNAKGLRIFNNIFNNCGCNPLTIDWVGGIVTSGWNLDIFDNTFVNNNRYGIVLMVGNTVQTTAPSGTGYVANVTNNIIYGTKEGVVKTGELTGIGIANLLPKTHIVNAFANNINGSAHGAFKNVNWDDKHINVNPLFVSNTDFHLKSKAGHFAQGNYVKDNVNSPCIFSTYEMGRYNGSNEASIFYDLSGGFFIKCVEEDYDRLVDYLTSINVLDKFVIIKE